MRVKLTFPSEVNPLNNHAKIAEQKVANKYAQQGWTILARNFRKIGTEIDIIAIKQETIVFVEVKWRAQLKEWQHVLNNQKIISLRRGAEKFLLTYEQNPKNIRFDLVLVDQNERYLFFPGLEI